MDDIEKFLRNAAARRKQQQPQQPAPPVQQQPMRPQRPAEVQYVEPEIVEPEILSGDSVAEHVSQHIANTSFAERAFHLGEEVGLADEHLEERLEGTFDHAVGSLQDTSVGVQGDEAKATRTNRPPVQPGDIAQLLASPQNIRQAIILNEILRRPDDLF